MTENITIIESKKGETENIDQVIKMSERLERLSKKIEESQKILAFARFKEQIIALIKSQMYLSQNKKIFQLTENNIKNKTQIEKNNSNQGKNNNKKINSKNEGPIKKKEEKPSRNKKGNNKYPNDSEIDDHNNKLTERYKIDISFDNESSKNNKKSLELKYSLKVFYIILLLNIIIPGSGTIIAAIGWGNTCEVRNRRKELIIRGIIQFLTFIFLVGWVQAIIDSLNYFDINTY